MTSAEGDSIKCRGDSCLKAISRDNNGHVAMNHGGGSPCQLSMNGTGIMSLQLKP